MKRIRYGFALVLCLGLSQHAEGTTYPVTNASDSGAGSLRAAIESVNANPPGPHRITFAIPLPGVQTVHLSTPLPEITTTVAIDGRSQGGYIGTPVIEVAGGASKLPFVISAPRSGGRGIAFNNFSHQCAVITADVCTVATCFIGTNAAGTATVPNSHAGVYVTGKRALIGGHSSAFRNVISGNATGVYVDASAGQDSIIGNYIGTDRNGTVALANQQGIISAAPGIVIDGNLISGNVYNGILTECASLSLTPADGTRIYRHWIGTDVSGMNKLANGQNGIELGCDYTIVGGIGKGNVISGNTSGISVDGDYSSYNEIRGNQIGMSADGSSPLGNATVGIFLPFSHNN